MVKKAGSGSGMNNPDPIFWVKILNYFDVDPGSGMGQIRIRDGQISNREYGMKKFRSWINIPDPQHFVNYSKFFGYRVKTEYLSYCYRSDLSCVLSGSQFQSLLCTNKGRYFISHLFILYYIFLLALVSCNREHFCLLFFSGLFDLLMLIRTVHLSRQLWPVDTCIFYNGHKLKISKFFMYHFVDPHWFNLWIRIRFLGKCGSGFRKLMTMNGKILQFLIKNCFIPRLYP
jgi:hypothetical protein